MTVACLVLGYAAPSVLSHAVETLKAAECDIFVHVDRKIPLDEYRSQMGEPAAGCSFIEDRIEVFWGGYSMILAEVILLEAAMACGSYSKFLLISDDAFPVLPPEALRAHLARPEDQISLQEQGPESPFHRRYMNFVCYDHPATTVRGAPPNWAMPSRIIDEALERKILEVAAFRRIGKKPIRVFYGSQFWALTRDTADLVLKIIRDDVHLVKSFEYSALPDETMIQSIIGNHVSTDWKDSGPVYVDFASGGAKVIGSPAELPMDIQESHVFLRKIAPSSGEMLRTMATHLGRGRTIYGFRPGERPVVVDRPPGSDRAVARMRLAAPHDRAASGWHSIESFWGRRFRWTAAPRITWPILHEPLPSCMLTLVITTVIGGNPTWLQDCTISLLGQHRKLRLSGGELSAEFDYNGESDLEAVLETPPLRSPSEHGSADTRFLGLSVAL